MLFRFQNGMELKTSTALVRTAYIQCMLATFNQNTISQASALTSLLMKSVDKAVAQPTQPAVVTEGLCAACMLLKLKAGEGEKPNNLNNFLNVLFDMDKQVFVSEKFLSVATDDGKKLTNYRFNFIMNCNQQVGICNVIGCYHWKLLNYHGNNQLHGRL